MSKKLESSFDEQAVQPSINLFPRRIIYKEYRSLNSS
jgi:hypothetical protein